TAAEPGGAGVAAPQSIWVAISGTAQQGQTLTANVGGNEADDTLSYAWYSSADGFSAVIGTNSTYNVVEGDEGNQIRVIVTDVARPDGRRVGAQDTSRG